MPQRFTSEDIEVQDCSGVIFRAVDSQTGETVAVRRFFPFGPTGGGLTADEQDEYASALEHLEAIAHPSLRSIVSGGCDPVDGIPFIATEWMEGVSLRHLLAERSLNRAEVTALLVHALEACEALSAVLGREGIWIETDPQTIIISAEETQRPITFWISPLRWLGQLSAQRGMEPLVTLTETAMGWSDEPPDSHGSSGLAGWLEWLRQADRYTSLAEARERLIATVGKESPPATHRPAQQVPISTRSAAKKVSKKSNAPAWILGCCVLTVAGLGGWILIQKNQQQIAEKSGPLVPVVSIPRYVPTLASDFAEIQTISHDPETTDNVPADGPTLSTIVSVGSGIVFSAEKERSKEAVESRAVRQTAELEATDALRNSRKATIEARGNIYGVGDGDLLLEMKGGDAVLEGRLAKVRPASGKASKTFFLEFEGAPAKDAPRAFVKKGSISPEMRVEHLKEWEGKLVRIRGTVSTPNSGKRPEIEVTTLSQVTQP